MAVSDENKLATLYVEVRAKVDDLDKKLLELKGKTTQAGKDMEKNLNKTNSGFNLMSIKAGIAAAGVAVLTKVISASIKEYNQKEEAIAKVTSALGKYSQKLVNQADALEKSSRFTDDQVLSSQALLAEFVKSEDQIAQLMPGIADLAEALNLDLNAAAKLVGKTLISDVNAFKKMGFEIEGAAGSTEKFNNILTFLASKQGRASAFTETTAGKLDQFNKSIDNVYTSIGQGLVPAIESITKSFTGLTEQGQETSGFFKLISFAALNVASAINTIVAGIEGIIVTLSGAYKIAEAVITGNTAALIIAEQETADKLSQIGKNWLDNYKGNLEKSYDIFANTGDKIVNKSSIDAEAIKNNFNFNPYLNFQSNAPKGKNVFTDTSAYQEEKDKITENFELKKTIASQEISDAKKLSAALIRINKQYAEDIKKLDESYGLIEVQTTKDVKDEKKTLLEDFYSTATFLSDGYYNLQVKNIEDERKAFIKAGVSEVDARKLANQKLEELDIKRSEFIKAEAEKRSKTELGIKKAFQTPEQKIQARIKETVGETMQPVDIQEKPELDLETQITLVGQLNDAIADGLINTAQDFASLIGDWATPFKEANSFAEKLLNTLISSVAQALAFKAAMAALDFISGGLLGFLGLHSGGVVQGGNKTPIPAFASGVNSFTVPAGFPRDSFPILVESGERVTVTPRNVTAKGTDSKLLSSIAGKLDALNVNLSTKEFSANTVLNLDGRKIATAVQKNLNTLKREGLNTENI